MKKRYLLRVLVSLSAIVAFLSPIAAEATLTATATTNGAIYGGDYYANPNPTVMCSTGYVLTATWSNATLVGAGEDYSKAFAITCTKLNDDKTLSALTEFKSVLATEPNNVSSPCTSGKAATAVRVRWILTSATSNRWVISTGTNCNNPSDYSGAEVNALAHNTSSTAGTVTTSTSSCQAGSFVIGIEYESGSGLHQVGAICGSFTETVPPAFINSASFNVNENIATSANAATISVSESSTITLSAGADLAKFILVIADSVTARIRFVASPNFEVPTDSGGNNVYDLTIRAVDTVGNASTQTITITVLDVNEATSFTSFGLAGSVTLVTYRTPIVITAVVSMPAKITFKAGKAVIPLCKNKIASGSATTYTATCTWKPSLHGAINLTAFSTPIDSNYSSTLSAPIVAIVAKRTTNR